MKIKCATCHAWTELGSGDNEIQDVAYKLLCPVLHENKKEAIRNLDLECPYMRDAKDAAVRKSRRSKEAIS